MTQATRTAGVAAAILLIFGSLPALAEESDTKQRDPAALYKSGEFQEAYAAYLSNADKARNSDLLDFNAGCAAFKAGNYRGASEAFARALTTEDKSLQHNSHYNLGNTLYRSGEGQKEIDARLQDWRSALQHYDAALNINPQDQAANFNRDLVRRKIEELEQQKQQQQQQQQSQQNQEQEEEKKDGQQEQQQSGGKGQQQENEQTPQNQEQQGEGQQEEQKQQQQQQQQDGQSNDQNQQDSQTDTGKSGEEEAEQKSGEGQQQQPKPQDGQTQPVPDPQRSKPLEGELQANDPGQSADQDPQQMQAAPLEEESGEMTEAQAARLLEELSREEDRVLLYEHRRREPVYKDW